MDFNKYPEHTHPLIANAGVRNNLEELYDNVDDSEMLNHLVENLGNIWKEVLGVETGLTNLQEGISFLSKTYIYYTRGMISVSTLENIIQGLTEHQRALWN